MSEVEIRRVTAELAEWLDRISRDVDLCPEVAGADSFQALRQLVTYLHGSAGEPSFDAYKAWVDGQQLPVRVRQASTWKGRLSDLNRLVFKAAYDQKEQVDRPGPARLPYLQRGPTDALPLRWVWKDPDERVGPYEAGGPGPVGARTLGFYDAMDWLVGPMARPEAAPAPLNLTVYTLDWTAPYLQRFKLLEGGASPPGRNVAAVRVRRFGRDLVAGLTRLGMLPGNFNRVFAEKMVLLADSRPRRGRVPPVEVGELARVPGRWGILWGGRLMAARWTIDSNDGTLVSTDAADRDSPFDHDRTPFECVDERDWPERFAHLRQMIEPPAEFRTWEGYRADLPPGSDPTG